MAAFRKPNLFEKVLLGIGISIIVIGYTLIQKLALRDGFYSWNVVNALFLWLILIVLIILAAVNENTKEELKIVIKNQLDEMKLLRQDMRRR